jgi:hypothetical protein
LLSAIPAVELFEICVQLVSELRGSDIYQGSGALFDRFSPKMRYAVFCHHVINVVAGGRNSLPLVEGGCDTRNFSPGCAGGQGDDASSAF